MKAQYLIPLSCALLSTLACRPLGVPQWEIQIMHDGTRFMISSQIMDAGASVLLNRETTGFYVTGHLGSLWQKRGKFHSDQDSLHDSGEQFYRPYMRGEGVNKK